MNSQRIKNTALIIMLAIFWVPFAQGLFNIFEETPLSGAYIEPEKPTITFETFLNGEFQARWEEYEDYNFGYRPFLIRLKNAIEYFLFKELDNDDIIEGRNGYLYSQGSAARTIKGMYYNGHERNEQTVSSLKVLKEGLDRAGAKLLIVVVPSKEMVIPEFLPSSFDDIESTKSDYRDLIEGYDRAGISYLNLCPYFVQLKIQTDIPLFTKTGYHWSTFGAAYAQDTILKKCESLFEQKMHTFHIVGKEYSDTARDADADFEEVLNLPFRLQDKKYVYPQIEIDTLNPLAKKPKVIIIGDSFFWQIKNLKVLKSIFSEESRYWYYFKKSFPLSDEAGAEMDFVDIIWELESADLVIIISNLGTLGEFPFGVTEYYETYFSNKDILFNSSEKPRAFSLIAPNNKYLCTDANNMIIADRDSCGAWEEFKTYNLKGGKVAIAAYNNRYLSIELDKDREITATRKKIADWETFTMISLGQDKVAIKAVNNKYFNVDPLTKVIHATSDSIGINETFRIEYLQAH